MPWYAWVFDGVGAAIVVPLLGWAITRIRRRRLVPSTDISGHTTPQLSEPANALTPAASRPPAPPAAPQQPVPDDLIGLLLAVPGMTDPAFRQRLYEHLPRDVAQQLHLDSRAARLELLGLIDTFAEYPHLSPWPSLLGRLQQLLPAHHSVQLLADELARHGLV